jgi:hypothetical protein
MGIDIYCKWKNQSKEEEKAQYTGFSTVHGHVGYLREAYHGQPYATKFLVAEAFAAEGGEAEIPAATLRARLPQTLAFVEERERTIYKGDDSAVAAVQKSFSDFVALCERREKETGEPCLMLASY